MDKNYLSELPENNLKAICLTTVKAVGFNENEELNLLEEVTSFVFLTCTSALAALKYIV